MYRRVLYVDIGLQDFDLLNVIGKGSFGKVRCYQWSIYIAVPSEQSYLMSHTLQVLQVRKKDNGRIYAMKVLNKKNILDNGELEHTRTEKNILQKLVWMIIIII